jgi:nicotinamidase-related amidase
MKESQEERESRICYNPTWQKRGQEKRAPFGKLSSWLRPRFFWISTLPERQKNRKSAGKGCMMNSSIKAQLPIPSFFDPGKVGEVWRTPYQVRAEQARDWAREHALAPAAQDSFRVMLLLIDVQNTFCIPDFELFVGGRSGTAAVEDNQRLCSFIYRNLANITRVTATLDTHFAMQIFHPVLLVDSRGRHPDPYTLVSREDIQAGRWKFNPLAAEMLGIDPAYAERHLLHYTSELKEREKFDLTIWPYHAMLGGIGHSLVPAVEEALFFHSLARYSQPEMEIKGRNPLTEHYSALGPEVQEGPDGKKLASKNEALIETVLNYDAVLIAGQAKSHCVAWTVADLLKGLQRREPKAARKIYLLDDCSSPVVVPGAIDYTEAAEAEYDRFAQAGMNRVLSTEPMETWPGIG